MLENQIKDGIFALFLLRFFLTEYIYIYIVCVCVRALTRSEIM